jgi:ribosome-associated protein
LNDQAAEAAAPTAFTPFPPNGATMVPSSALAAARAAEAKLGQDTVILAMRDLIGVVDAFVVTSGRNVRQVRTIVEEVELVLKADGTSPRSVEGLSDATWVLMDYGDILVHVFLEETRAFYDLEHLWSSAPRVRFSDEAEALA